MSLLISLLFVISNSAKGFDGIKQVQMDIAPDGAISMNPLQTDDSALHHPNIMNLPSDKSAFSPSSMMRRAPMAATKDSPGGYLPADYQEIAAEALRHSLATGHLQTPPNITSSEPNATVHITDDDEDESIVPSSSAVEISGRRMCQGRNLTIDQCNFLGCCQWTAGTCQSAVGDRPCTHGEASGVQLCENNNFNERQCHFIGCCVYDLADEKCWSAVGNDTCIRYRVLPPPMPAPVPLPDTVLAAADSLTVAVGDAFQMNYTTTNAQVVIVQAPGSSNQGVQELDAEFQGTAALKLIDGSHASTDASNGMDETDDSAMIVPKPRQQYLQSAAGSPDAAGGVAIPPPPLPPLVGDDYSANNVQIESGGSTAAPQVTFPPSLNVNPKDIQMGLNITKQQQAAEAMQKEKSRIEAANQSSMPSGVVIALICVCVFVGCCACGSLILFIVFKAREKARHPMEDLAWVTGIPVHDDWKVERSDDESHTSHEDHSDEESDDDHGPLEADPTVEPRPVQTRTTVSSRFH